MENSKGFFEDANGDKSNSRLNATLVVVAALVFVQELILISALVDDVNPLAMAPLAGTLFMTVAGPALIFMFKQKKQEK